MSNDFIYSILAGIIAAGLYEFMYYYPITKIIRGERKEIYKQYSELSILSALDIELKPMNFRFSSKDNMKAIDSRVHGYNEGYKIFPNDLLRIKEETDIYMNELSMRIEEAAKKENKTLEEVMVYLKPFPFLKYYFEKLNEK